MKLNWGFGIAIFYIIFVLALVFQVWKSTTYDNSLVEKDYYAKDLAYQDHYTKLVNARSLEQDLRIVELPQKQAVGFYFPAQLGPISREIHFFCPSTSQLDFRLPIQTDGAYSQMVPTAKLKRGLWKVKVDWQADGKEFYKEEAIVF
jgi:hypothetical protein